MKPGYEFILLLMLFNTILTAAVTIGSGSQDEFELMLEKCCSIGSDWANTHNTCTGYTSPVSGVPVDQQASCLSAVSICCIRLSRQRTCIAGRETARLGQDCTHIPTITGGEAHKDCCESCKLGMIANAMKLSCTLASFQFGYPWDDSFLNCCKYPAGTSNGDEDAHGNGICKRDHRCAQQCEETTDGSYKCSCLSGYTLMEDQHNCKDINECETSPCASSNTECVNTIGGFLCVPRNIPRNRKPGNCPQGFVKNPTTLTCDDVDECKKKLHNCLQKFETCRNTIGSFECKSMKRSPFIQKCEPGYEFVKRENRCIDIDECARGTHQCNPVTESCENIIGGGYRCKSNVGNLRKSCKFGTKYNSRTGSCEDVNECLTNIHSCRRGEFCLNTPGSYECHNVARNGCPAGYKNSDDRYTCVDVNECLENLHSCNRKNQFCNNTDGSYDCINQACPPGYKREQERGCIDVNECKEKLDQCHSSNEECVNMNGSYKCQAKSAGMVSRIQCPSGYKFDPNTFECADIDECSENTHDCVHGQRCQNSPGQFQCVIFTTNCQAGHFYNFSINRCQDIDECKVNNGGCIKDSETCVNFVGSFTCSKNRQSRGGTIRFIRRPSNVSIRRDQYLTLRCNATGFPRPSIEWLKDGVNDVAKESRGRLKFAHQKRHLIITDTVKSDAGVYSCIASNGGKEKLIANATVIFSDECELGTHLCDRNTEKCIGNNNGYVCQRISVVGRSCGVGFVRDGDECVDINECQTRGHQCPNTERCDNTIGSYSCIRVLDCGTGYTWNAYTKQCEDNDECASGVHRCGTGFTCANTQGSFKCERKRCGRGQQLSSRGVCEYVKCSAGFEGDETGRCVDINECLTGPCHLSHLCLNTEGSYKCESRLKCGAGYRPDATGTQCTDIDECSEGVHKCFKGQICENSPGGYTCTCPVGHRLNQYRQCEDVNECSRFGGQICALNSVCENTIGSYNCKCKVGFRQLADGRNCEDIDECLNVNTCEQRCTNTWGSYHCSCNRGYEMEVRTKSCKDINECEKWKYRGKLCSGICVNEPGSYSCRCPAGYRLSEDKHTCKDIDECEENRICQGQRNVCLNTRGGYKCNTIRCPPDYFHDTQHKNRCKRKSVECSADDNECLEKPSSYSYNYLTFPSNMPLPPGRRQLNLFTMRGPTWSGSVSRFELRFVDVKTTTTAVPVRERAARNFFRIDNPTKNQVVVSLIRSIRGPQDIELELILKMYHRGVPGGMAVAKIFIFVPEYDF